MHVVKLIGQSVYEWEPLLELALQATGDRLADEADASPREFTNCERIASGLRRLILREGRNELDHIYLTFALVIDERALDEVITELGELAVIQRSSHTRAVLLVVSGTFAQWKRYCQESTGPMWDDIETVLRSLLPFTNQKRLA